MRAADVMTRDVATCRPNQTAADAARVMWDRDCGVVPVVDEHGSLRGIVTDRDLLMATQMKGKSPAELPLSSLISGQVISGQVAPGQVETCLEDSDVESILKAMARRQIRRVPVVDAQ